MNILLQKRQTRLIELKDDPYYSKFLKRLTKTDTGIIQNFLTEHGNEDNDTYQFKANRLFLGIDTFKPKNWALIIEIITILSPRTIRHHERQKGRP